MNQPIPSPFNPPLAVNEEQARKFYGEKVNKFLEKLRVVEKDTGMTIAAYLEFSQNGIVPKLIVIPLPDKKDAVPEDKKGKEQGEIQKP